MTRVPLLIAGGFVALLPMTAIAADDAVVTSPNSLQWGAAPPALPKGAQMAVLFGDPTKEGPFVYRLKLPAGYQVAAHMHPNDENVTVISGSIHIGMGDKLDTSKGDQLPIGGYLHMPKGMHHYAWTTEEAVIQNNGIGPAGIIYVNPADDPRKTN